jgi:hypothetical protein
MASALPVTKGARVARFVPHATPAAERAIEPDSREIRAMACRVSRARRSRVAPLYGEGAIFEPTFTAERWFLSGCYRKAGMRRQCGQAGP